MQNIKFQPITVDQVIQVYSGKAGRCCCGCSGKYSYSEQAQAVGHQKYGRDLTAEDINQKMVKKVVAFANAHQDLCSSFDTNGITVHVSDTREYNIYLFTDFTPIVEKEVPNRVLLALE